jgi:triosephosphate isomerase
VFSIGGEEYLSNEEIEDTIQYIKDITFEKYETTFKVLYGGGISNDILKRIITIPNIDGYLIGNNSTDIGEMKCIINTLNNNK